jgi:hypothetical protein
MAIQRPGRYFGQQVGTGARGVRGGLPTLPPLAVEELLDECLHAGAVGDGSHTVAEVRVVVEAAGDWGELVQLALTLCGLVTAAIRSRRSGLSLKPQATGVS